MTCVGVRAVIARKCNQTKKGGLKNVKSIRNFSRGNAGRQTRTQCRVASGAGVRETRCFCRGHPGAEFHAPETSPPEMGGVTGRSPGDIILDASVAAVLFAGPGHASAEHDAAD